MLYRIADTVVMLLLVMLGCCMKMEGFSRCGNAIIVVGLLRILINCLNLNFNIRERIFV